MPTIPLPNPKPNGALFGLCPKCNKPLVYNAKNELIVCLEETCDFTREYTAEDRAKVDKAAGTEFTTMRIWADYYGEGDSLNDELMAKEILNRSRSKN